MHKAIITALIGGSLVACGPTRQEVVQNETAYCASIGFHPGTDPFAECIERQDNARAAAQNAAARAIVFGDH